MFSMESLRNLWVAMNSFVGEKYTVELITLFEQQGTTGTIGRFSSIKGVSWYQIVTIKLGVASSPEAIY